LIDKKTEYRLNKTAMLAMHKIIDSAISEKKKVGALVVTWDSKYELFRFFSGANFWFSESFAAEHAEQFALKKALLARCYPIRIYVSSSKNNGKPVFLCGLCKEFVSAINSECEVIVIRPNGTIKGRQIISEKFESKNFEKKNKFFRDLCGFHSVTTSIINYNFD